MFELPAHIHPMVVHFPIALFIMALVFEMIGFTLKNESIHKAALYMYIAAALTIPLVVRTGMGEAIKIGLRHPLLDQHRNFSLWTMWVSLMSLPLLWFIKEQSVKYFRIIFVVFLIVTAVLVSIYKNTVMHCAYDLTFFEIGMMPHGLKGSLGASS